MNNNPFWDFSLQHYAGEQVQAFCLQLQEQAYANVNIVLLTQWLAACERTFDYEIVASHADLQYWHEQVIVPLRQARTAIKHADVGTSEAEMLYGVVKQSELDAERVEQDILFSLCEQFPQAGGKPPLKVLAQQNLQSYLQTLPLAADQVGLLSEQIAEIVFKLP